jgi:hypothetical protein
VKPKRSLRAPCTLEGLRYVTDLGLQSPAFPNPRPQAWSREGWGRSFDGSVFFSVLMAVSSGLGPVHRRAQGAMPAPRPTPTPGAQASVRLRHRLVDATGHPLQVLLAHLVALLFLVGLGTRRLGPLVWKPHYAAARSAPPGATRSKGSRILTTVPAPSAPDGAIVPPS